MRIFNRAHLLWFFFVLLASAVACLLYVANFYPAQLSLPVRAPRLAGEMPGYVKVGATPLGLIFGSVAFGIFIFAGLLGLRKKFIYARIGSVQQWLRAHIWLTLLTIPLVLLHSGFRLGGPMTSLLLLLYSVVMVSGIYGLVLQHQLPALMKEKLPSEPVYQQLPQLRAQLLRAAEKMRDELKASTNVPSQRAHAPEQATTVAAASPQKGIIPTASNRDGVLLARDTASQALLLDFLERQALPYFRRRHRSRLTNRQYAEDLFRFLKLRVSDEFCDDVEQIEQWCEERRWLDYQTRLQHWLHGWLFVHVPFSYLLILLTAWHAYVTLFRY